MPGEVFRRECPMWGGEAHTRALLVMALVCTLASAFGQGGVPVWKAELDRADSLQQAGAVAQAITVMDSAVAHARLDKDPAAWGKALIDQAAQYQMMGENDHSLTVLYEALAVEKARGDEPGLAEVYNSIGAIQHYQKNFATAEEFYRRSGAIVQRLGLVKNTAKYWNNMGTLYQDKGLPREAITWLRKSLDTWEALQDTGWAAISYLNLGTCYQELGSTDSARTYLAASMQRLARSGSEYQLSMVRIQYGLNEVKAGRPREALRFCEQSRADALRMQNRPLEQRACGCLAGAYEALGENGRALAFFKRTTTLRDSIFGQANAQAMTRIEMDHDFEQQQLADSLTRAKQQVVLQMQHQAEVAEEREGRNIAIFGGAAILALAGALWSRLRYMRRSRARIQRERDRSDRLLLNILPGPVAQELKDNGSAKARDFASVTILFSDFEGFTRISETMSAQELVGELHACFMAFDGIITARGIEKIKTIGDAYMCAGGLPDPATSTPAEVVHAALEMQAFMEARKKEREAVGKPAFQMRIGIHTGPVVAGIVGVKKFAYDIWGDTVNIASRMESCGEAGKVNISEATYALVNMAKVVKEGKEVPAFTFEPRGKVQAKGKGELEMYFVGQA
ncbi:MAG: adenylate/guanylate cyclase domain-containing protein [Flavobacteriales bacterium]